MDLVDAAAQHLSDALALPVYQRNLLRPVTDEPTGLAVVVRDGGVWGPSPNSIQRKVLTVLLHADCTRDASGLPLRADAAQRAWAAWDGIDLVLHNSAGTWRAVVQSVRQAAPSEVEQGEDEDLTALLIGRYEVAY
ncbi:hypothetical protein GCM10027047_33160 [Rhodococcus aerolatus]